jgi:hypothetical protein
MKKRGKRKKKKKTKPAHKETNSLFWLRRQVPVLAQEPLHSRRLIKSFHFPAFLGVSVLQLGA